MLRAVTLMAAIFYIVYKFKEGRNVRNKKSDNR